MSVFDKLTDKSTYTGMYANHDEKAIKHDDQTDRKATSHAKGFGEAPVQKFGLQIDKPVKIICWHGLDKHATGQKLIVKDYRTMDQLLAKACAMCAVSPQPTYLHSATGKPVKNLSDLEDGVDYLVIQSGAKYRVEAMPIELKKKLNL